MASSKLASKCSLTDSTTLPTAVADDVNRGVFADTKDFKCYVSCLLDIMQVARKGKVNYEKSLKQIDTMLPDNMKPAFRAGLEACKTAAVSLQSLLLESVPIAKLLGANVNGARDQHEQWDADTDASNNQHECRQLLNRWHPVTDLERHGGVVCLAVEPILADTERHIHALHKVAVQLRTVQRICQRGLQCCRR
uniref:Uncharacterized protein n=1 Tax=Anopheles minimus TaxID=112268 RepID=A0A182W3A2_9DIPT